MSIASPRYVVVSANRFDGTTPLATAWSPAGTSLQPRQVVNQDVLGRLSFADLSRPGNSGVVVMVRRWSAPALGEAVQVRSVSASETQDDPPTIALDTLLKTIAPTTEWSAPIFLGPTDALAFVRLTACTYELLIADELGDILARHLYLAAGPADDCCTQSSIEVTGGDQQLQPWAGTLHVQATMTGNLQLPASADLTIPAVVVIHRDGGEHFLVYGDGDPINGALSPAGIVFEADNMGVRFELTGNGWDATYLVKNMAPIPVTDGLGPAAIPTWDGDKVFNVSLAVAGPVTLPDVTEIAPDQKAYVSNLGNEATLTLSIPGSNINGIVGADVVLPARGDAALVVRDGFDGYRVLRDTMGLAEAPTFINSAAVVLTTGWRGRRTVLQTAAAASTFTLPPAAGTPIGCTLYVGTTGAGGTTVGVANNATDDIVGLGASANTVAQAQNVIRRYEFLGSDGSRNVWMVT